jgi:hypothetical protein
MSNARFSILQARAVEDKNISNAQFRTLAALGMYGDKEGWCFPKLQTLAIILGKSKQAVSKDLQELQTLGYVEIRHQFRPDGGMKNSLYRLQFGEITPPQRGDDTPSTPEIEAPYHPDIDTPSTSEVDALTPHINDPINAPKEEVVVQPPPNLYGVYEREVGILTKYISESLEDMEKTYPDGWPILAIREAKKSATRGVSIRYIESILKRWKAEGLPPEYQPEKKPEQPAGKRLIILSDGTITETNT